MTTITGKFDGAHENGAAKEFAVGYDVKQLPAFRKLLTVGQGALH